MSATDSRFGGSVPAIYRHYLVPLIFQPYAADLAARVRSRGPARILEIAAGTGVVTRALSLALGPKAAIIASDLNQAMLDEAAAQGPLPSVEWRQADALHLPFPDTSFEAVVCQFGVMFFPDKATAFSEAYRVLRPGGFLFLMCGIRFGRTSLLTRSPARWKSFSRMTRLDSWLGLHMGIMIFRIFRAT
jgi:ubiquinone/menaquinone biosynthesis C-methylase UbiE